MKKIISYLLTLLVCLGIFVYCVIKPNPLPLFQQFRLALLCVTLGGVGGCVYCLRGVYLNACVRKSWDSDWQPWYYIRPIVSLAAGGISYVFLKAGLLVLEAEKATDSGNFGFLALAFVAGLNVDKFIAKIEEIAQSVWGIEKSKTAKNSQGGV